MFNTIKRGLCLFLIVLINHAKADSSDRVEAVQNINQQLNQLHQFAAEANAPGYFALFSGTAVFIGTDPSETWKIEDFKSYVLTYFKQGYGWEYHPTKRHIYLSKNAQVAWFDELLENEKYGTTRGTGVLQKYKQGWKIEQYHLTLPIPNQITPQVVDLIRRAKKQD